MADVTINNLSPLTPSTGLVLPVSNGSSTGRVTLAEVCGVMTSTQIINALGYTPYNGATNPNGYITSSSLPSSQQLPKAWVNFNGTGIVGQNQSIRSQFNVSSVVKNAQGDYTVNFTSSLIDANYCLLVSTNNLNSDNNGSGRAQEAFANRTSSSCRVLNPVYNDTYRYDSVSMSVVIFR